MISHPEGIRGMSVQDVHHASRWEERLLRSPAGPLYRAIVTICSRIFLAYYAGAPTCLRSSLIWEQIGHRYLFRRAYTAMAKTAFGAEMQCNMKDLLQRHIMYFGVWEPNLTAFLERRLASGDVFIDIGANIGYFSLLAAQCVGAAGTVVAIEAAPQTFRMLEDNLARSGARNVRAVQVAVAGEPGTIALYFSRWDANNLGATTTVPARGSALMAQVLAQPLERIVTPDELTRTRVVKIDIEGAELAPLNSLLALTPQLRADIEIVVELSPQSLREAGSSAEEILAAFESRGFHGYDLQNSYAADVYVKSRPPLAPCRIHWPITEQTDIVFSREDAEEL